MLEDILNNPNFGRLYSSGHAVQSLLHDYLRRAIPDKEVADRIKMSYDDSGQVLFRVQNDSRAVTRRQGESLYEYLNRTIAQAREGFSQVSIYDGTPLSSATGGYRNAFLDHRARLMGVTFREYKMPNTGDADAIVANMTAGGKGIIIGKDDNISMLFADRGTETLGTDETHRVLGFSPEASLKSKRYGFVLNEVPFGDARVGAEGLFRVGVVPEEAMVARNASTSSQFNAALEANMKSLERQAKSKGWSAAQLANAKRELTETFLERGSDAVSQISESSFRRMLKAQLQDLDEQEKIADKTLGGIELARAQERIQNQRKTLRQMSQMKPGSSATMRAFNLVDASTSGSLYDFMKGESVIVRDSDFVRQARLYGVVPKGATREDILHRIDILAPSRALENKMSIADAKLPLSQQTTYLSLNPLSPPKVPKTNSLTLSTFAGYIDRDGYLMQGLKGSIADDVADLQSGKIPKGLEMLARAQDEMDPRKMSPEMLRRSRAAASFINRYKALVRTGGDPTQDPAIMAQGLKQIEEHYFKLRKGGGTPYDLGGDLVDRVDSKLPMQKGTVAHLRSETFGAGTKVRSPNRAGVLVVDSRNPMLRPEDRRSGGFMLSSFDSLTRYRAFGGFDFDDSFYGFYQYDHKTKRLVQKVFRDPNAMGEFFVFDADITHDVNLPKEIRQVYQNHQEILHKIERLYAQNAPEDEIERAINSLNRHKRTLDGYFSGKEVEILGARGVKSKHSQNFIRNVDLFDEALTMPDPIAHKLNRGYSTASKTIGYSKVEMSRGARSAAAEIVGESVAIRSGNNAFSLYSYVDDDYDDYGRFFEPIKGSTPKPSTGKLKYKDFMARLRESQQSEGTLGRVINQYTLIDSFIGTNLDFGGQLGIDPRIQAELERLLKKHRMTRADREALIDALVQESDGGLRAKVTEGLDTNSEKLGKIMRELQDIADSEGILNKDGSAFKVGLDPLVFQERAMSRAGQENEIARGIIRGYGSSDFLLDPTSPMAYRAKLQLDIVAERESLRTRKASIVDAAAQFRKLAIGTDYSPEELVEASKVIQEITALQREAMTISDGDILKAIDSGDTTALARLSKEGIETSLLARMHGMKASQVRAIERVLLDSNRDLGSLAYSVDIEGFPHSVDDIFKAAYEEEEMLRRIRELPQRVAKEGNLSSLQPYFGSADRTGKFLAENASYMIDQAARNEAMVEAIFGTIDAVKADQTIAGKRTERVIGSLYDLADQLAYAESPTAVQVSSETRARAAEYNQYGEKAREARAAADNAADSVFQASQKRMREFRYADLFGDSIHSKAVRGGLAAMAAFAVAGIVHKTVTGDRDVGQADPYPMISKAGESIDLSRLQLSEYGTAGGGMTYRVTLNGANDQMMGTISSQLNGILDSGSTIRYDPLPRTVYRSNQNSQAMMNARLGS